MKGAYQVQVRFRVEGNFDPERFREAWQQTIDRHEALRMAVPEGDTAFMVISSKTELPFIFEDWSDEPNQEEKLQAYLTRDRKQGFELNRPPLLRLAIFKMGKSCWEVALNSHHLTMDGWSLSVVMADVLKIYHGEPLTPPLPFKDYAAWLQTRPTETALSWWRESLAGFDKPNRIDLAVTDKEKGFGEDTLSFSADISAKVDRLARELRTTQSTVLQALWGALIGRLSGDEDVVFGNVVSGRPAQLPGVENMVGMFINTVPVRIKIKGHTVRTIIEELTGVLGEREEHEYAPLHLTQGQAPIRKGTSLFETLFVYENYPVNERLLEEGKSDFTITDSQGIEAPHYPLSLVVLPGKQLTLKLSHDRQRYDGKVTKNILNWLKSFVYSAIDRIDTEVSELSLLDANEYDLVVKDFNATDVEFPRDKTLCRLFEEQAERTPDNIAVRDSRESLTYAELNRRANRIAHALISKGVKPDTLVGLCLERSVKLSAAILGIHKAGGGYVPIDPRYPAERFAFLVEDAGLKQVIALTTTSFTFDGEFLFLDKDDLSAFPEHNPSPIATPENLAYVIYTSGSTGKPKGVAVEHRGVVNRISWLQHGLPYTADDVIIQKTPITFDVSLPELYGGYLAGASVCMLDPGAEKDPARIVETIEESKATSIHFVASMLEAFLDHLQSRPEELARCSSLNRVFTSGEAVSRGPGGTLQSDSASCLRRGASRSLRANRGDHRGFLVPLPRRHSGNKNHRSAGGKYATLCSRPLGKTTAGWGPRRAVHRRSPGGPRLSQPTRTDGGEVCSQSLFQRTNLQNRRPGALAAERRNRISRPPRPPGQNPRFQD